MCLSLVHTGLIIYYRHFCFLCAQILGLKFQAHKISVRLVCVFISGLPYEGFEEVLPEKRFAKKKKKKKKTIKSKFIDSHDLLIFEQMQQARSSPVQFFPHCASNLVVNGPTPNQTAANE